LHILAGYAEICTIFAFRAICKFSFAFRLCPGLSLSSPLLLQLSPY
ncbi:hypothetical protein T07_9051, partial [Trichinella nelsoni]